MEQTENHSANGTPNYIKALLAPTSNSRGSRRAWSIDVENIWVPFFTATNVMGETDLADDVLGAPIRLAKGKDGEVRFTQTGRPVMRVQSELNSQITIVRENFVAGLQAYTGLVQNERMDDYAARVATQQGAALPILEQDAADLAEAVAELRMDEEPPCPDADGEAAPSTDTDGEGAPSTDTDGEGAPSTNANGEAAPSTNETAPEEAKPRRGRAAPQPEPATEPTS